MSDVNVNFGQVWDIFERGIMYVKIDDDVVWTYPPINMFGFRMLNLWLPLGIHWQLDYFAPNKHQVQPPGVPSRFCK